MILGFPPQASSIQRVQSQEEAQDSSSTQEPGARKGGAPARNPLGIQDPGETEIENFDLSPRRNHFFVLLDPGDLKQAMANILDVDETKQIEIHQNVPPDDEKTLRDVFDVPSIDLLGSSITLPPVNASNFEINPTIIMMIKTSYQFRGLPSEDPYDHIADFLELCTTFKIEGASDDAIYLRLFPLSLSSGAKRWLRNLPAGSIRTWKNMANQFLLKYYSYEKTRKIKIEILNFSQGVDEPLHEAWDRFKGLLKRCPHLGLPDLVILETFYLGLSYTTQLTVNAAAGGSALDKTPNELCGLIERMTRTDDPWLF